MYTENFDPGFEELKPEDFHSTEIDATKSQLLNDIEVEFQRLKFTEQQREGICHSQLGTTNLEDIPSFYLKMFRDYISRFIVKTNGTNRTTD